jgi:hypothetical protein
LKPRKLLILRCANNGENAKYNLAGYTGGIILSFYLHTDAEKKENEREKLF